MKNLNTFFCIFYLIASLHLISFSYQINSNFKKNIISKKIADDSANSDDGVIKQLDNELDNLNKQRHELQAKIEEIKALANDEESAMSEEEIVNVTSSIQKLVDDLNDSIKKVQNEKDKIIHQREKLQNDPKQNQKPEATQSEDNSSNKNGQVFIQLFKDDGSQSSSKKEAATYASACLQGALSAIPGSFCYKKGGDAGVIPTGCPDGYFRSLALCYEECRSGYKFVAGVCWEKSCKSGYTDFGLTCTGCRWKGWKLKCSTYAKDSYIPSSLTNFSDRIPCPSEMYKSGALCYRDCAKAGLVNCGIGACASSSASCAAGIGMMALEFALGALQLIFLVLTFGASSGASSGFTAARTAFSKLSQATLKDTLKTIARIAAKAIVKERLKAAAKAAAKAALKKLLEIVSETLISSVCEEVTDQIIASANNSVPSSLDLTSLDPTGIASAIENCSSINSENDKLNCAKSVLNAVSTADVTGLTAMAGALIQEICPWV